MGRYCVKADGETEDRGATVEDVIYPVDNVSRIFLGY